MRTSDRQVNSELALSIAKGILPWVPFDAQKASQHYKGKPFTCSWQAIKSL